MLLGQSLITYLHSSQARFLFNTILAYQRKISHIDAMSGHISCIIILEITLTISIIGVGEMLYEDPISGCLRLISQRPEPSAPKDSSDNIAY